MSAKHPNKYDRKASASAARVVLCDREPYTEENPGQCLYSSGHGGLCNPGGGKFVMRKPKEKKPKK